MKKILRSRLPERLSDRIHPLVVEVAVGLIAAVSFLIIRVALSPLAGDRAPYAFVFVALVVATVLAGWRSGLVALVVGQILTWYVVVDPQSNLMVGGSPLLGGLTIATISQLIILAIIGSYQREIDRSSEQHEQRMELLHEAMREIDHRTRNNYQTVIALVQLQAQRADPGVKAALQQVTDRIAAVSKATERLALRGEDLETVRLGEHLRDLCRQIEHGLSRDGVEVECELADVSANADKAAYLSIIVNELLTNALKHAFAGGRGGKIRVESRTTPAGFELIVSDDGSGIGAAAERARPGLGRKLVESFVRQLGGKHQTSSSQAGTTHRLLVPDME